MSARFWRHLLPARVSERALRPSATWGLGLIAGFSLLWAVLSGALLAFAYVPEPGLAHESVLRLQFGSQSGALLRAIHRHAAHLCLLVATLHLARVVWWGAYGASRRRNFFIGLALLATVLGFCFTGYLLPWDQQSVWGVSVIASALASFPLIGDFARTLLLGGGEIGASTLHRFYAMHVGVLPVLLTLALPYHLWRLRKDGGLACEAPDARRLLPSSPHLLGRLLVIFCTVSSLLLVGSLFFDAPVGASARLWRPDNPEKAAWYLLWLQEAASVSTNAAMLFVALGLAGLVAIPFVDRSPSKPGVAFAGSRLGWLVLGFGCCAFALMLGGTLLGWQGSLWGAMLLGILVSVGAVAWGRSWRGACCLCLSVMLAVLLALSVLGTMRGKDWQLDPGEVWNALRP